VSGPRRRGERGAVAVEFALVLLPLVVLLFGAIQYGLYFWAMQGGSDIARSAARVSSVGDVATSTCAAFRADIQSQINGLTGSGATATITRTFVDTSSPADGVTPGDTVQVSVQFTSADMHFPFIPMIHDGMVTSTAQARVDFVPDPDNPPQDCS
jgi:Flp pilus assembly protein TadG